MSLLHTRNTLRDAHFVLRSDIDPLIKTFGDIYRRSVLICTWVSCLNNRTSKVGSPDVCCAAKSIIAWDARKDSSMTSVLDRAPWLWSYGRMVQYVRSD